MIRPVFLGIFIIVVILFTIGYSLLPLITGTETINQFTFDAAIYVNKLEITDSSKTTTTYNYSDLDISSSYKTMLEYLYYGCIMSSCLIGGGIIVSYLKMKLISKILFILVQIFMTTFVSIILFMYYSTSFLKNLTASSLPYMPKGFELTMSFGSGGILVIVAYVIMVVNFILYSFIG